MTELKLNDALATEVMDWAEYSAGGVPVYATPGTQHPRQGVHDWNPAENLKQLSKVVQKAREIVGEDYYIHREFQRLYVDSTGLLIGAAGLSEFWFIDHPTLVLQACLDAVREVRRGWVENESDFR